MDSLTKVTKASKRGRDRDGYGCSECGHRATRWFGRCPACGSWESARSAGSNHSETAVVTRLTAFVDESQRFFCGHSEFDRVLGGGFVAGEVLLLAGEPGIGKSTLILQLLDGLAAGGRKTLLVTGEESPAQVGLRARRLGVAAGRLPVVATTSLSDALDACSTEKPDVLVVDSVQTLENPHLEQAAGSPLQVRECAAALVRHAKASNTVVLLVGHVTKDGSVAGPKTLEHVVDAVLTLEGERTGVVRLLRVAKNRFGSCDETGVFTMGERGLETVADPSAMLLADRRPGATGSVVFPSLEGTRTLLIEVQALVDDSGIPHPRRVALGTDSKRLALLAGVLSKSLDLELKNRDIFVCAAGGLTVKEPAVDLALCLSIWSSMGEIAIDPGVVALGEVGLSGEVRRVPGIERRLKEAARHGFSRAIAPRGSAGRPAGMEVTEVRDLREAVRASCSGGAEG